MWAPRQPEPPAPGWWTELSFSRWVDGVAAEMRDADQTKRLRQLRRRIERLDESMVLAADRRGAPVAPVEFRASSVAGVNSSQRIIELVAVPYEEPAVIEYRGEVWAESFSRGAFDGIETRQDQVRVNRDHDRNRTVGKVVRWWPSRSEGLVSEVRVAPTVLGDETLTLAGEDMLSASVAFAVRGRDQVLDKSSMTRRIRRAHLDHLSFVEDAAYRGAKVLAVRGRTR